MQLSFTYSYYYDGNIEYASIITSADNDDIYYTQHTDKKANASLTDYYLYGQDIQNTYVYIVRVRNRRK